MSILSNQTLQRYTNWLPFLLLVFPTVMVLRPLLIEINPRTPIFYTPMLPIFFQLLIVAYAMALGGMGKMKSSTFKLSIALPMAVLFFIACYSTVFVAINPFYSSIKLLDLILFVAVSYSSSYMFETGERGLAQRVLIAIFASVLIAVPIVFVLFYFEYPTYYLWPNFIPGFDYIRIYGFSLTVAIAAGTGLIALPSLQKTATKLMIFIGLVVLWTTLFWSSSRGGIFSLLLVVPVIAVAVLGLRKGLGLALLAVLLGAGLSIQIEVPSNTFGFFGALENTFQANSVNEFSANRMYEWGVILEFISIKPLFGYGYGQNLFVTSDVLSPHAHVHNIVLEATFAWGWIGAACAGYLVIRFWLKGFQIMRSDFEPEKLPAFLVISVLLVYAWVDGIYFYYQALIPLAICIGIVAAKPR